MTKDYYLAINGQAEGPFSEAELRQRISSGQLSPDTLAARDGAATWESVESLVGNPTNEPQAVRTLRSVRDRLLSKGPAERLGLSGDPQGAAVKEAHQRLKRQLERQKQETHDEAGKKIADEIEALLNDAAFALTNPLERFIRQRAESLGVDPTAESNRSYIVNLYYQEEGSRALKSGQWGKAAELFGKLLESQPDNVDGQWQHALALYQSNPLKTQDALATLRTVVAEYPQRIEPLSALVDLLLSLGRKDEALSLLKTALEKSDKKAKVKALFDKLRSNSGGSGSSKGRSSGGKRSSTGGKKAGRSSGKKSRADSLIAAASEGAGERDHDSFAVVKVAVVCAVLFGWLWHTSTATPDRCFPAGEQEYFYDPGNYYQYAAPGGDSTGQCLPSMAPRPGKSFFNNLEAELDCRSKNAGMDAAALQKTCARIPYPDASAKVGSAQNFFYTRRFALLLLGLLLIAFLGSGDSIGGRVQKVGFGLDPAGMTGAVFFGLVLGFLAPTQFVLNASLGGLLVLTFLHVVSEEIFFRGFVTRKLMDQFDAPMVVIVLAGLIFGIYHLTFASFYWMDAGRLPMAVGMLTVGAGIPYAWLYVKSESIVPPLTCHLLVNSIMMWSSHGTVQGMLSG
tara:strand:+ start:161 stop:2035 length:1875 start_codon:yes stop_codon:yes gene_type:complete